MRDLPENMSDRYHADQVGAKHFGRSSWLKAEIYYRNASPSIAIILRG